MGSGFQYILAEAEFQMKRVFQLFLGEVNFKRLLILSPDCVPYFSQSARDHIFICGVMLIINRLIEF